LSDPRESSKGASENYIIPRSNTFEVVVGMDVGLLLAEERGEPLVELDQLLGRGTHIIWSHGGALLTG
jgi:hypothetical protein